MNYAMIRYIIGWILNVISMKFYVLDKEKMVEVQKTLEERRKKVEAMEAEAAKETSGEA